MPRAPSARCAAAGDPSRGKGRRLRPFAAYQILRAGASVAAAARPCSRGLAELGGLLSARPRQLQVEVEEQLRRLHDASPAALASALGRLACASALPPLGAPPPPSARRSSATSSWPPRAARGPAAASPPGSEAVAVREREEVGEDRVQVGLRHAEQHLAQRSLELMRRLRAPRRRRHSSARGGTRAVDQRQQLLRRQRAELRLRLLQPPPYSSHSATIAKSDVWLYASPLRAHAACCRRALAARASCASSCASGRSRTGGCGSEGAIRAAPAPPRLRRRNRSTSLGRFGPTRAAARSSPPRAARRRSPAPSERARGVGRSEVVGRCRAAGRQRVLGLQPRRVRRVRVAPLVARVRLGGARPADGEARS